MSPFIKAFFIAQTFLTRLPTPKISEIKAKELSTSLLYYPLIGLGIGCLLVLVAWALSSLVESSAYAVIAAIIVTLWVFITGALHLDGLADTADGFVGGQGSFERTVKIMKDPVSGPAGIASIFLVLIIKYSAIIAILDSDMSYWGLLLAPIVARAAAIGLLTYSPVSQQQGLAFELKKTEFPEIVALILCFIAIIVFFVLNLYVLIVISVLMYAIRCWSITRLNGISGDILGLSIEVIEAVFLIMAVFVLAS
jgi:adenosylcobinamide-GDP ribazoletransferase